MRFYFNMGLGGLCAEEDWVVNYLVDCEEVEDEDEAIYNLHTKREFAGWFECDVTDSIRDKIEGEGV